MKLKLQTYATIAVVAFILAASTNARADAVADWNAIAVNAILGCPEAPPCPTPPPFAARPGPTGVLDIAMVQAAVYDAVQAIEGEYQPYYTEIPGASGSPVAATAKAAHDVLVSRFPAQTTALDQIYLQYLTNHGLNTLDAGIPVGAAAAAGIIALRAGDGSFPVPPPPPFIGGTDPGVWRPTLPANAPMVAPWLATVTPFTVRTSSQFRAKDPPALNSPEYTRAYNEVKTMGSATNSGRTTDQTDLANFWNLNYVVVWNTVLRTISNANVSNISDSSRLFAMAETAMADALITSWDSKVHFVYWRPITGIREGDNDGNPKTEGDASWLPLVATPAYPDYTSGANNITGAATRSLSLFFGTDEFAFTVTTTNTGPTTLDTRPYTSFSQVRDEVVNARIWEGIHFRFADKSARKQGEHVAQWTHAHYFRPVDDSK